MDTPKLFPYQQTGSDWLATRKYALLADEMGLGKTPQAISAAWKSHAQKILVICPANLRVNWEREVRVWSGYTPKAILNKKDYETPAHVKIVSFDFATAHTKLLCSEKWDLVIVDEVHFIKTTEAKRSEAIYGKNGIIRHTEKFWAISGTPAPKHAGELWILLYTLGLTTLSYQKFVARYCTFYMYQGKMQITGTRELAIPELNDLMRPLVLRRKVNEVLKDLPPVHFSDLIVEPDFQSLDLEGSVSFSQYMFSDTKKQELQNKIALERELLASVMNAAKPNEDVMTILQSMAKSNSTLRRYNGLLKIEPVAQIVEQELEAGAYNKIILFCVHRDVVEGLRIRLSRFGAVTVYGGTDPKKVQKRVDAFQRDPKTQIFIGNMGSAGTGLTLTASNQVMIVEDDYNPSTVMQAWKRAHRIGQTMPVFVRCVGLNDPLDIQITATSRRRASELAQFFI